MTKNTAQTTQWELALVNDAASHPPALPSLFGGAPATREEQDVVRKFTLDIWEQAGATFKAELAQCQVEHLQRGAFDRSVSAVDYMVRQRDLIAHPETREFANQLLRQAGPRNAELQFRLVDIAAGRLMDLAGRALDPDPEPERQPGFWERVFGA